MDPADWDFGTADLSLEEEAAYLRIVNAIHKHTGPVPDNDRVIAGLFRTSTRKARSLVNALIEAGKLTIDDGKIWNERARSDLVHRGFVSVSRAESGAKGGRTRSENADKALKDKDAIQAIASAREEKRREEIGKIQAEACTKRAGRLSKDFSLPRDWGEWAVSEGWPEDAVRTEAMKFKDYWISKSGRDATKLDWLATWRNWMRNSKSTNSQQKGNKPNGRDIADRVAARFEQMGSGEDTNPAVSLFPARHAIGRD